MKNKAHLQFLGYKVRNSYIKLEDGVSKEFEIGFDPKAVINKKTNLFILFLNVFISDSNKKLEIRIDVEGCFKFKDREDERIEEFLYLNAPAILFPYIRSYVNTISILSGHQAIILPTLNLSGLREKLKDNTTEADE